MTMITKIGGERVSELVPASLKSTAVSIVYKSKNSRGDCFG